MNDALRIDLEGPRLRLRDIAVRAGISKSKVLDDVRRGDLVIVRLRCGTRWMALVDPAEATRYLAALFHVEHRTN